VERKLSGGRGPEYLTNGGSMEAGGASEGTSGGGRKRERERERERAESMREKKERK
jgi:hypothetical protein